MYVFWFVLCERKREKLSHTLPSGISHILFSNNYYLWYTPIPVVLYLLFSFLHLILLISYHCNKGPTWMCIFSFVNSVFQPSIIDNHKRYHLIFKNIKGSNLLQLFWQQLLGLQFNWSFTSSFQIAGCLNNALSGPRGPGCMRWTDSRYWTSVSTSVVEIRVCVCVCVCVWVGGWVGGWVASEWKRARKRDIDLFTLMN